jgi:serine phosphatase RsbU (regulator of sigma subunit)
MEKFETSQAPKLPNEFLRIPEHQQLLERLRRTFRTESYEEFKTIAEGITRLYEVYRAQWSAGLQDLITPPPIFLEEIIGRAYIKEKEERLRALRGEHGIYAPLEDEGGGDFWEEDRKSARVGSVKLLDMMGHGVASCPSKILAMRMIELYRRAHPEEGARLFAALDQFIAALPSTIADYVEVNIENENGQNVCAIELAGGIQVYIRHPKSGEVTTGGSEGYTVLGTGTLESQPKKIARIPLPDGADIYIFSDGLFDISTGDARTFGDEFQKFCEERKGWSADEFKKALIEVIQKGKETRNVRDDITIVVVHK